MGVHKLCVRLRSADPQDDPDVIRGVLKDVFDKMPPAMRAMKIADHLYQNDLAYPHTLARLEVKDLESLGISMGAAVWVLSLIRAEEELPAQVTHDAAAAGAQSEHSRPAKQPELRKFPAPGADGWPSLKGWAAYETGYALYVEPEVSADAALCVRKVNSDPEFEVPDSWSVGGQDDRVLSTCRVR